MAANSILELQKNLFKKMQIIAPYLGFVGGIIDGGVFEQQLFEMRLYPLGTFDLNVRCRDSPLPALLKWFLTRTWKKVSEKRQEVVEGSEEQTWVIVPDCVKDEWDDVVKSSQELQKAIEEETVENGWQLITEADLYTELTDMVKSLGEESGPNGALNKRNPIFLPTYSSGMKDVVLVVQNLKEGLEGGTSEEPDKIEQGATLIFSRQEDMDNFVEERKKLLTDLEVRKAELMRQRNEEDVKLEKEFDEEFACLIKKYQEAKQVSVRGRVRDMS